MKLFLPGPDTLMPRTRRLWSPDDGKPVARMIPLPLVPLLSAAPALMAACELVASLGSRGTTSVAELATAFLACQEACRLARGMDGEDDPRPTGA